MKTETVEIRCTGQTRAPARAEFKLGSIPPDRHAEADNHDSEALN
jgi:hypothetical protein